MPQNVFDQFDGGNKKKNVFDQFDSAKTNVFDQFDNTTTTPVRTGAMTSDEIKQLMKEKGMSLGHTQDQLLANGLKSAAPDVYNELTNPQNEGQRMTELMDILASPIKQGIKAVEDVTQGGWQNIPNALVDLGKTGLAGLTTPLSVADWWLRGQPYGKQI